MLKRTGIFFLVLTLCISGACAAGIDDTYVKRGGSSWGEMFSRLLGQRGFGKSYALVIGVGDYDHYRKLSAPADDAMRVRNFLRDEAQFDYIITLTDEKATRARIERLMESELPQRVQRGDRFLFYFSGHGVTRKLASPRGYLILKSSSQESWDQMIDMPHMREWQENFGHAQHVLFLLDACFSGLAAFERKAGFDVRDQTIQRLIQPAHHIVTAGVEGEESFIFNGQSLFTSAFLAAARGEMSVPTDGVISLSEIMVQINRALDGKRAQLREAIKMTPRKFDSRIENNAGEFFFIPASIQRSNSPAPPLSGPVERKGDIGAVAATDPSTESSMIFSPWTKSCEKGPEAGAKQICFTEKDGRIESGQQVIAAVLIEQENERKKTLRVTLPLGMQIQHGTRVIVDSGQPLTAPYAGCFANGCIADYEASSELIGKLKNGQALAVQAINGTGQAISFVLPLGDFSKVYDGLPARQSTAQSKPQPAAPLTGQQLIFSPWTKFCLTGQEANAKQVCFTGKDGRVETGQPVVAAVLIEPDGDPKKILRLTLPLGMSMAPGTRAIVDQGQPMTAPYALCFNNGCMSDYEASADLIQRLKRGQGLTVQGVNGAGQPISLVLPLNDFAKAHDGPPTDPKVFEAQQNKLQEDLQKRADDTRRALPR
jgi:invasion protein IalB